MVDAPMIAAHWLASSHNRANTRTGVTAPCRLRRPPGTSRGQLWWAERTTATGRSCGPRLLLVWASRTVRSRHDRGSRTRGRQHRRDPVADAERFPVSALTATPLTATPRVRLTPRSPDSVAGGVHQVPRAAMVGDTDDVQVPGEVFEGCRFKGLGPRGNGRVRCWRSRVDRDDRMAVRGRQGSRRTRLRLLR